MLLFWLSNSSVRVGTAQLACVRNSLVEYVNVSDKPMDRASEWIGSFLHLNLKKTTAANSTTY